LKLPSVGVAKTLYHVDGIENNEDHHQKVCHLMSSNIGITSYGALGHVPPQLTIYFFYPFSSYTKYDAISYANCQIFSGFCIPHFKN